MTEIGLFPIGLVLLPTEEVPLHIFEDRYKELISECIERDAEFGLVYADEDGIRHVGTKARVTRVLTRFDDGRLNIVIEGGGRFTLHELTSGRSFHTALVSPLEDDGDPAERASVEEALRLFGRLREVTGSDVEVPDASDSQLSYMLAGKVELAPDEKLELLADLSERSRMTRVRELLEGALATAQRVRQAAERAVTNGRVELG